MLVHSSLFTGVRILKQEAIKVAGNMSYSKQNSTQIFEGLCLIDDSPRQFKGRIITDYGIDIGKVFIVYLDDQTSVSKLDLPKLEIQWNYDNLHKNMPFDLNELPFTCKIIDIDTPHGLLLSHTELLVTSVF